MARPSSYDPKIHPTIVKNLAKKHFIDSVIADMLGITENTFIAWKKKFPEFMRAVRQGKDEADEEVVNALFDNTQPSTVEEVTITDDGEKKVTRTKIYRKKGSVGAQKLWLINRRPDEWRDTQHIEQDLGNDFKEFLENMMGKKNIPTDELLKQIDEDNKQAKEELELNDNKENE